MRSKKQQSARKTGIDILGDVPWGSHFCLFYETEEDLIDILVPYVKAGLKNNELCVWVTSEPLNEKKARDASIFGDCIVDRGLRSGLQDGLFRAAIF